MLDLHHVDLAETSPGDLGGDLGAAGSGVLPPVDRIAIQSVVVTGRDTRHLIASKLGHDRTSDKAGIATAAMTLHDHLHPAEFRIGGDHRRDQGAVDVDQATADIGRNGELPFDVHVRSGEDHRTDDQGAGRGKTDGTGQGKLQSVLHVTDSKNGHLFCLTPCQT